MRKLAFFGILSLLSINSFAQCDLNHAVDDILQCIIDEAALKPDQEQNSPREVDMTVLQTSRAEKDARQD